MELEVAFLLATSPPLSKATDLPTNAGTGAQSQAPRRVQKHSYPSQAIKVALTYNHRIHHVISS